MGLTTWFTDSEASYPDEYGCCCQVCLKRFSEYMKEHYPDTTRVEPKVFLTDSQKYPDLCRTWNTVRDQKGVDLFRLYRRTILENSAGKSSLGIPGLILGNYGTHGARSHSLINYDQMLDDGVVDFGMPALYGLEPWQLGKKTLEAVKAQKSGITLVWISRQLGPGGYTKWYPVDMLRPLFYEVFLNGARGFTSFTPIGWDGYAFREYAQAMNVVRIFEDIIVGGRLLDGDLVEKEDTHACGLRMGEEIVVLSNQP